MELYMVYFSIIMVIYDTIVGTSCRKMKDLGESIRLSRDNCVLLQKKRRDL